MFNIQDALWEEKLGIWTAKEISQQPITWLKTLNLVKEKQEEINNFINKILSQHGCEVIFTGAGTSEFVGNSIFTYLNKLGKYNFKSYATTDILASPENYLKVDRPTLLVSFGRSGNSPESVGVVELADQYCSNVKHLFVTCNIDGALSKYAQGNENAYALNLTPETHDKSFAMTSSFTNMYLAALLCFNLDCLDTLTPVINEVISTTNGLIKEEYSEIIKIVDEFDFKRIVYLGSNCNKGVAQESALKMLELSAGAVVTMFDTPLGFRHGPKSIINDDTLTVVYLSDDEYTRKYELDLIKEMSGQRKANKILAVSSKKDDEVNKLVDYYYCFNAKVEMDSIFTGLQNIVVAQIIALFKSLALGCTPDNPCPTGEVNRVVTGVTVYPYK